MKHKTCCKDCKHWGKRLGLFILPVETEVSDEFVSPSTAEDMRARRECGVPVLPASTRINWDGMTMCQHPSCFQRKKVFNPLAGIVFESVRVAGQAQNNPTGNCPFYRRKWWKFWAKA